jgi:uncharacterized membrane protein
MTIPSPAIPHGIPPAAPGPGEPSRFVLRVIRTAGHLCLIGILIFWVVSYRVKGPPYDRVWELVLAQLFGGRAGGVGWGLEKGFSTWYLLFHCMMYDFIIMLYIYPFFVTGYQFLERVPFVGKALNAIHNTAIRNKARIQPFGVIGLICFVFFPFWSTGPLVGVIVGYLIGLRTWVTFTSVIAGNIAAISLWILAYDSLRSYSPRLALFLLIVIFAFAMAGTFYARLKRRRAKRAAGQAPENAPPEKKVPDTPPLSLSSRVYLSVFGTPPPEKEEGTGTEAENPPPPGSGD